MAVIEAMKVPELRARLLFVFAMLVVFRFLAQVPVPGVDRQALADFFRQNDLFGFLDVFSGGALRSLSVVALGVFPYITASIIMQLMVPVFPQLKELSREGEVGRQRINQLTHYLMVPIAALQAFGQLTLLQQGGAIGGIGASGELLLPTLSIIITMVAGSVFLVWIGELITEKGIGNGISIIIFAGIVATLPQIIGQGFLERDNFAGLALLVVIGVLMVYLIVMFTEAERRIPVQYGTGRLPRRADVPPGRRYSPPHKGELSRNDTPDIRLLHHDIPGRGGKLLHQPRKQFLHEPGGGLRSTPVRPHQVLLLLLQLHTWWWRSHSSMPSSSSSNRTWRRACNETVGSSQAYGPAALRKST